jgi:hypothetical protein
MSRPKASLIAVATAMAALCLAIAGAALASSHGSKSKAGHKAPQAKRYRAAAGADAALRTSLPALSRAASARDLVPAALQPNLIATAGETVDLAGARVVGPAASTWVVPAGKSDFCVGEAVEGGGSVVYCSTASALATNGFVGATYRVPGGYVVSGVLTDGAHDVTVATASRAGAAAASNLVDGAIKVQTAATPTSVSWTDAAGHARIAPLTAP